MSNGMPPRIFKKSQAPRKAKDCIAWSDDDLNFFLDAQQKWFGHGEICLAEEMLHAFGEGKNSSEPRAFTKGLYKALVLTIAHIQSRQAAFEQLFLKFAYYEAVSKGDLDIRLHSYIRYVGNYRSGSEYDSGQIVKHDDKLFMCTFDTGQQSVFPDEEMSDVKSVDLPPDSPIAKKYWKALDDEELSGMPLIGTQVRTSPDLEQRLRALEERPSMIYRGVFDETRQYNPGDVVTHDGSAFHCNETVHDGAVPGKSNAWTLAVKRGRDGKNDRR